MTEHAEQHDPLAGETDADPFETVPADPPADPLAPVAPEDAGLGDEFLEEPPEAEYSEPEEELPPGVAPGSLGGVNPSEEQPVEGEPEAEVPAADDSGATDQDLLSAPQWGAQGITQLESEEDQPAEEPLDEPLLDAPEPEADAVEEEPETPEVEAPAPEPDPAPKPKAKRRRRKKAKDHGPGKRAYTILSLVPSEDGGTWREEFEVVARSSEGALRQAYRKLSGNTEAEFTLVPVPSKYWNPEPVKGKVPEGSLAIKVG